MYLPHYRGSIPPFLTGLAFVYLAIVLAVLDKFYWFTHAQ